ncbi:glycosyltransferase family 4 protein [Winogradskyella aurantia]|nr:glycosyltransferase family 4 protein [Winogradskyella aurantia]
MKILIIGPFPEPTTGLSLSNEVVHKGLLDRANIKVSKINMSLQNFEESVGAFSLKKAIFFLRISLKAYQVFKNDIIYITIGQSFFGVLKYALFIYLSKMAGKQIIIHLHGNTLINTYNQSTPSKKKILRSILSKTSKAIVLSESLKANFKPFIQAERVFVLNNFVEHYLFLKEQERQEKTYNKLKIVYLSNLMTEKGIFYFLDALEMLNQSGVKFEARCAGNIDFTLKSQILDNFEKIKNATYLGVVKENEKRELLKWGNVFVFPSYLVEGLPLAILEAMVTGNIIVSTEHQALRDYFDSTNIHYIDKKSKEDIAAKLTELNNQLGEQKTMLNKNYKYTDALNEGAFVNNLLNIIQKN